MEHIAKELGWVSNIPADNTWNTVPWSLNDTAVRAYLGKPSGAISLQNAYRVASPVKVTIGVYTATTYSVTFNWTAPAGKTVTKYWISRPTDVKPVDSGLTLSYTVSGLVPGSKAVISVYPEVINEQVEYVMMTWYAWMPDVTGLSVTQIYTGNGAADTWSLTYVWVAVPNAIGYYYSLDNGVSWTYLAGTTTYTRSGLTINQAADFRVYAVNAAWIGSHYATPYAWTIYYESPTGLYSVASTIIDTTWRYVNLYWLNIAAKPGWYYLEVNGITTPSDIWTTWVSETAGDVTNLTGWSFRRGQQYKFRVYAADSSYGGTWSEWFTFTVLA
jgi:hypothetical protein